MTPIFFDSERTEFGLKKVNMALDVFETYLDRLGTSHAASENLTIADLQLFNSTMTLEAIDFDFSKYKKVCLSKWFFSWRYLIEKSYIIKKLQIHNWYNNFKRNYPDLWEITEDAIKVIKYFIANPPDLSHLNHPIYQARQIKNE